MTDLEVFFIDKVTFTNFIKIDTKGNIPKVDTYGGNNKTAYTSYSIPKEPLNICCHREVITV